jgi:anti-anti-sigma factor
MGLSTISIWPKKSRRECEVKNDMNDIKISLDSSGIASAVSVVRVDGVIDTMTATELEKVMNSLLDRGKYKIIVDLGGVDYISSAGWGIFISNIREIRQHSGDIKLVRMIPNVYEIFELLEFDSILRAFDSIEKARSDFEESKYDSAAVGSPAPVEVAVATRPGDGVESQPSPTIDSTSEQSVAGAPEARVKIDEITPAPRKVENMVLEMVAKDPFYTVSEIKRELERKNPGSGVGWWKIWNILRRNSLLNKKSRFRRARDIARDR